MTNYINFYLKIRLVEVFEIKSNSDNLYNENEHLL